LIPIGTTTAPFSTATGLFREEDCRSNLKSAAAVTNAILQTSVFIAFFSERDRCDRRDFAPITFIGVTGANFCVGELFRECRL
jgi:hypothetical protein